MRKLLIANRGEIACRIARTAHRMGIRTVAVFGSPDRDALHVAMADEAIDLEGESAAETYLDIGKLLRAAARSGADAIHPGYGFLSESAPFSRAVMEAGLTFVGPGADAMERLGSKAGARQLAVEQGIPVLPGYDGADQERLAGEALRIGAPLLVKASAGGGGRGMRVVRDLADLPSLLAAASAEALAAFGDGSLILERLVETPRHVEVQVFADDHGNVVHLGERDCTLQRRHQKVIEESPAAFLPGEVRAALCSAATRLIGAAGYRNAATVEFLLAPDLSWHLIEVNTRLQVEHPVTEAVSGQDLVEWQLRIARGERLPLAQADLRLEGHAIELRICAEDPAHGMRPTTGRITELELPEGARLDHGLAIAFAVGAHFDSLLAKLVVHAADRAGALRRARAALACTQIGGVVTNIPLLDRILREPAFQEQRIDTNWLEPALPGLLQEPEPGPEDLAIAAVARVAARPNDPADPWFCGPPWRCNLPAEETVRFDAAEVTVRHGQDGYLVRVGDATLALRLFWTATPGIVAVEIDGHRRHLVLRNEPSSVLFVERGLRLHLPGSSDVAAEAVDERVVRAPLPGKVVEVRAEPGMRVAKGDLLVVIDAMKMEHRLLAPGDGMVAAVAVGAEDRVEAGQVLVELEP
ncbi:acetyl/propionyl/methylcrotonyl-CoA carboxylase subunit alpha [Geminicoccus roseus]|uniref:acetyl/propionyl/methylcrotonyl-CoA carboxylase subunit alpha n=1 Tax=Geminicoccus roseus TaxID=404900 RepID=UPI000422BADB|nr:biotin carboxylase N-terminal domain-containing protein [Geminicoccus roseus]